MSARSTLSFRVLTVQAFGKLLRFGKVIGQEQPKRLEGCTETSGGIDAGCQTKADVAAADRRTHIRDRHQCGQARPACLGELLKPAMDEDAVLTGKRHKISECRERDNIEVFFEVDSGIACLLQQGMDHFEGNAGTAKVVKIVAGLGFTSAAQSGRGPEISWWSRMITSAPRLRMFVTSNAELVPQSTAIKSLENAPRSSVQRPAHSSHNLPEHAAVRSRSPSHRQSSRHVEQRQGGDPIHVVVAIKNNPFTSLDRVPDTIGGLLHFRKEEGICQPS